MNTLQWEVGRPGRPTATSALALNAAETLRTLQLPRPMPQGISNQPAPTAQVPLHDVLFL